MSPKKPRVLIIDDSARSRMALADALHERGCEVVGRALDGRLGLKMALELEPDVITCDLEMPRMDGFTFLRIIATQKATPIIMVTSDARPESAIQALELGARDFVVKPGQSAEQVGGLGDALAARIFALAAEGTKEPTFDDHPEVVPPTDVELIVIGASTVGPRAIRDLLSRLHGPPRQPILIAQHMPPRFTTAFARRLGRITGLDVDEAVDKERLRPGVIRVAPGSNNLAVVRGQGGELYVSLEVPNIEERHVPNVDRLLYAAADVCRERALGIVLTGMGKDGADGARALASVGGTLWAESKATAVIDGMPSAAAAAHPRAEVLHLDVLSGLLSAVAERP
jgi:two-component system chemotaxis response regulator CheB